MAWLEGGEKYQEELEREQATGDTSLALLPWPFSVLPLFLGDPGWAVLLHDALHTTQWADTYEWEPRQASPLGPILSAISLKVRND